MSSNREDYHTKRTDEHCTLCSCPILTKTASLSSDCGAKAYNLSHPGDQKPILWEKYIKKINMAIEPIIDFELAELVRFYGSIVGTEGVSKEVQTICNENIKAALDKLQPSFKKTLQRIGVKDAGLIT